MKRIGIMGAMLLALALLSPGGEGDVGDLLPVELIYVYIEADQIHVETDAGQWGVGQDLTTALADLQATAPGKVFLETADYLIVTEEAAVLLPQLTKVLRPAAQVCMAQSVDQEAAAYLSAHEPGVTLADIRAGEGKIPILVYGEGRYHIES